MVEKHVQTLERSLDVLECLAQGNKHLGVTEIGKRINLHKSTVHRILQTLHYRGYVQKENDNDRYYLGLKIVELGSRFLNDLEIRKVAGPLLADAAEKLDEAVHLVMCDAGDVVYLDTKGSSQVISMNSKVGRRAPMHCTAAGKAMLAFLPEDEVKNILRAKGLARLTEKTITDTEELFRELNMVRENKIAFDNEENEVGIICLGAPLFDLSGKIAGAVSVSGPANRIMAKGMEKIGEVLKKVGEDISTRLGFNPF